LKSTHSFHQNKDLLRLLDAIRRCSEREYMPGLPGAARHASGAEQARSRTRNAGRARAELHGARAFAFCAKELFLSGLPKGYQITQYELPLATAGHIEIEIGGAKKRIGITRLHLEEDAAKNLHEGFKDSATKGYVDYNRCGSPLSEIVSEPDMRTPEEAYQYLTTLRQILLYTGVSDCNMEEGSLRCDANVSIRLRGRRNSAPSRGQKPQLVPVSAKSART